MASHGPPVSVTMRNWICLLPDELVTQILSNLSNIDLKRLRLTCRFFGQRSLPRISRVFLSANYRNIEVLLSVADHPHFKKYVTEVVWDDALLQRPNNADYGLSNLENKSQVVPKWFSEGRNDSIFRTKMRRPEHSPTEVTKQLEDLMSTLFCWRQYQNLLDQQETIIADNVDINAFEYALKHFKSLKKISITPTAHGILLLPAYKTPMIRDFIFGFAYPIPRGWPNVETAIMPPWLPPWEGDYDPERYYRGYHAACRILAQPGTSHHISEVALPVFHLKTGLSSFLFSQRSELYENFAKMIRRPGFKYLDLSIIAEGSIPVGWKFYSKKLLFKALKKARNLEHVSLTVTFNPFHKTSIYGHLAGPVRIGIPLRQLFPPTHWNLRHFGLCGFPVAQADLIEFLSQLPSTLQSVELGFLVFHDFCGDYRSLLEDMRDKLGWRDRPVANRPRIKIKVDLDTVVDGMVIWVGDEAEAFVYQNDVPNPFGKEDRSYPHRPVCGTLRDEFNPDFSQPYVFELPDPTSVVRSMPVEWNARPPL